MTQQCYYCDEEFEDSKLVPINDHELICQGCYDKLKKKVEDEALAQQLEEEEEP
jgi:hypothetical protein